MPPPASTTLNTFGQWSRPAVALIFGVRPNSEEIMTSVDLSSPVRSRSLSACRTTVRLTSKRSQSAASVGIFSPGVSMPEAIARSSSCSSWK